MANTPRLDMAEISESQASKYVTHNSALRVLDALVQAVVADKDLTAAPGGESDGDTYLIIAADSGDDWDGHENDIAYYSSSAYTYHTPEEGWTVYVQDENAFYTFNGSSWVKMTSLLYFKDLADTTDYAGDGYKLIRVNSGQTALEYVQWTEWIKIFISGKPTASEIVFRMVMVDSVRFGDDFYLSRGNCETGPADSSGYEFAVQKNGVEIGQIHFASGATSATFTTDSGQEDFLAGDVLKVVGEATPDADFENIAITLRGLRI